MFTNRLLLPPAPKCQSALFDCFYKACFFFAATPPHHKYLRRLFLSSLVCVCESFVTVKTIVRMCECKSLRSRVSPSGPYVFNRSTEYPNLHIFTQTFRMLRAHGTITNQPIYKTQGAAKIKRHDHHISCVRRKTNQPRHLSNFDRAVYVTHTHTYTYSERE